MKAIITFLLIIINIQAFSQQKKPTGKYVWVSDNDMRVNGRSSSWHWQWVEDKPQPDTATMMVEQLIKDFSGNITGWKAADGSVTILKEKPKPTPKTTHAPKNDSSSMYFISFLQLSQNHDTINLSDAPLQWRHTYVNRKKVTVTKTKRTPAKPVKKKKEPTYIFTGTGIVDDRFGNYIIIYNPKGKFTLKK